MATARPETALSIAAPAGEKPRQQVAVATGKSLVLLSTASSEAVMIVSLSASLTAMAEKTSIVIDLILSPAQISLISQTQ